MPNTQNQITSYNSTINHYNPDGSFAYSILEWDEFNGLTQDEVEVELRKLGYSAKSYGNPGHANLLDIWEKTKPSGSRVVIGVAFA